VYFLHSVLLTFRKPRLDFPVDAEPEAPKNEKQRMRVEKRKRAQEKLNSTRTELFQGGWDA
jgi:hypothetical protein